MASGASASDIIADTLTLLRRSVVVPPIAVSALSTTMPARDISRPCALILSPHPDDECLVGALPLRLHHEGWQIINIAVTLGSNEQRWSARQAELAKSCATLGFECLLPQENGFSAVTSATRSEDAATWEKMTTRLSDIIAALEPKAIFMPHAHDAHSSHIGTHWLGMDALAKQSAAFTTAVVQTEYWHPHEEPNLMVGLRAEDAAKLLTALSCHSGENARNPFDARFPAYLIDNVRRGSERVGGKGGPSASMDFAMLYKFGVWRSRKFIPSLLNRIVDLQNNAGSLFD